MLFIRSHFAPRAPPAASPQIKANFWPIRTRAPRRQLTLRAALALRAGASLDHWRRPVPADAPPGQGGGRSRCKSSLVYRGRCATARPRRPPARSCARRASAGGRSAIGAPFPRCGRSGLALRDGRALCGARVRSPRLSWLRGERVARNSQTLDVTTETRTQPLGSLEDTSGFGLGPMTAPTDQKAAPKGADAATTPNKGNALRSGRDRAETKSSLVLAAPGLLTYVSSGFGQGTTPFVRITGSNACSRTGSHPYSMRWALRRLVEATKLGQTCTDCDALRLSSFGSPRRARAVAHRERRRVACIWASSRAWRQRQVPAYRWAGAGDGGLWVAGRGWCGGEARGGGRRRAPGRA